MTNSSIPLSREAVQRTIEPHLELLGRADRERIKSLVEIIQPSKRILLSDALNVLYPTSENDDQALSAFRQFRLRLKTFAEKEAGIEFVLKSDTQTRTKPNQRWCWFEGSDRAFEDLAILSDHSTDAIHRIAYLIQQQASVMRFDSMLPPTVSGSASSSPVIIEGETANIMALLEKWVQEKKQPYCALLGEYGMGKTIASMRFTQLILEKRKKNSSLPLPIYLDLRNLGNKERYNEMTLLEILHTLINNNPYGSTYLENTVTAKDIIRMVQEDNALVIFDGLDEVLVHLSAVESQRFTYKLLSILQKKSPEAASKIKSQLLISCRTHYFRTNREQKNLFTEQPSGKIPDDDYLTLMMHPLTHQEIRNYLTHTLPHIDATRIFEIIKSVYNLSELAERPYTLSLIPHILPQLEQHQKNDLIMTDATIYRHLVLSWLERDSGKHKLTIEHKQQLMGYLAAALQCSNQRTWTISDIEQWFVGFLHQHPEIGIHYTLGKNTNRIYDIIDMLKEDLRTATFLVRIGEANFCFAHASLQEFFLATYLYEALENGTLENWDMPLVNVNTLRFLGQMVSERKDPTLVHALETLIDSSQPKSRELALAYSRFAQEHNFPAPSL